jgi:hypothetical protein
MSVPYMFIQAYTVCKLHKNTAMSGSDSRTNESYTVMRLIFFERRVSSQFTICVNMLMIFCFYTTYIITSTLLYIVNCYIEIY